MFFLLMSVCLSVTVSVLLKVARQRRLDITQMVAVNYPVAALLTWLVARPSWANADGFWASWWLFALLSVLLPLVFVVMGRAVQAAGIVRADAAQRSRSTRKSKPPPGNSSTSRSTQARRTA